MEKLNYSNPYKIETSRNYPNLLTTLVRRGCNGFVEYKGGPLNLPNKKELWVSPVEVYDTDGPQSFHILYVNTKPGENNASEADVFIFDEMQAKLGAEPKLESELKQFFESDTPRVVIRPIQVGINVYPYIYTPDKFNSEKLSIRIEKLSSEIGLKINRVCDFREAKSIPQINLEQTSGISAINEHEYITEQGRRIFVSDLIVQNDPWRFYQVLSGSKLSEFLTRDKSEYISVRIDSGCDSGQLYHDRGCECRDQLHRAIEESVCERGIIIHIPTQDGRGYGMVTKMETEGIKRGFCMNYNYDNPAPVDTIKAAKLVFGESEEFDIRTFDGAARILKSFGVNNIRLMTDNKTKIRYMTESGLNVQIIDAQVEIKDNPDLLIHLRAKKEDKDHYNGGSHN